MSESLAPQPPQPPQPPESLETTGSGAEAPPSASGVVPRRVAPPQRRPTRHAPGRFRRRESWQHLLELALDLVDRAADRVADATGIREPER